MSLTSRGSARFNWQSCSVASLKVPPMILWCGNKGTWHRIFSSAQHRWPDLWHYICCFSSAFTVERNTHTHTHTHIHRVASSHLKHENLIKALNFIVGWGKVEPMSLNLIWLKNGIRHGGADQLNGYLNNLHRCIQGGLVHRFYCHLHPEKRVS